MLSEITSYLQLNEKSDNTLILVTKDDISDINFVFCEILSHFLKNNYAVILLNFVQSYAHYNHVLLKAGISVRQLQEKNQFIIIDTMSEIEKLTNSTPGDSEQSKAFKELFCESKGEECVKQLYMYIKKHVTNFVSENKQVVLFVDDISLLLNLGLEPKYIFLLVQYCRSLLRKDKNTHNSFLLGTHHFKNDENNDKMVNYLLHMADIRIQVEGLKTGFSKDVHGKISLQTKDLEHCTYNSQKMLFKITENGAQLL